jgi:hypothetical protein
MEEIIPQLMLEVFEKTVAYRMREAFQRFQYHAARETYRNRTRDPKFNFTKRCVRSVGYSLVLKENHLAPVSRIHGSRDKVFEHQQNLHKEI